jgi:hypothetical protein
MGKLEKSIRFEVPLAAERVAELEELSQETGVRPRDLARLAITQLLANRGALVRGERPASPKK